MSAEFAAILVDSTSHALRIEKLLVSKGMACKLIPVPRHLSSDCGVCVRILNSDMETIKTLFIEHHINDQAIEAI
ncbi:MAG: DUF3343 domain-containing protein [Chloroflexota bacterium]